VGIKYEIASNQTVMFFMISFVVLITLNFGILYFFSKSLSDDISLVADGLNRIASGEDIDHYKKLAVTSNDEIGDLVIAFNKIQDITVENIKSIRRNQDILTERERLASLGQLIGGIAHNLKTPIMSISGGLESLVDLINEYDQSIGNLQVTNEDHHEIAKEMLRWIEDIKPHCSYMSDIITAVKGQAVKLNATTTDNFSIDELIKHIEVLMKYELIKNACELKVDMQINPDIQLQGELGSLVQVFNNLITNSIHAYDGKPGTIDFIVKKIDNYVEFIVKDYGMGIPEKVKDKLFKEMITTKAKEGTGLGLYMSYSTIRGRFSGDIRLESEQHVGTTFYITIPLSTI
jgi:signal transduction histidine kinase